MMSLLSIRQGTTEIQVDLASTWPSPTAASALLTDLYELTMLEAYFEESLSALAVFELQVRRLPPNRNFLLAAGLEQALDYLETLHFTPAELDALSRTGRFSKQFLEQLSSLRFTGDVEAMAEGTAFFPQEPILRVTAPLPEAQLVETRLVNLLQYQTMVASKAARSVLAAPGKLLIDFGLRRTHGAEAGLLSARAAYLAGFSGSSNLAAERWFGIPAYGTMAHSYVQAHDDEATAFLHFARANPNDVVLLIDTYDTEAAAQKVVALAPRLEKEGIVIKAVRIDSGDLGTHARAVRALFDAGGLTEVRIFASGNLDEFALVDLAKAPIDGFGIGTRMGTSDDAPHLDCAYKLVEYAGRPRRKRSEGKVTLPGRKQVHRRSRPDGTICEDLLMLEGESAEGVALLQPVMRAGRRLAAPASLDAIRHHVAVELGRLPSSLRSITEPHVYPVAISRALRALATGLDRSPTC
jgi:nicotinate phosphoribosyltransferase